MRHVNLYRRPTLLAMALMAILNAASCRDGRQGVVGKVSVDGLPLARGSISFLPAEGNAASTAGAIVENGRFNVSASQGLMPGKYRVTIQAWKETSQVVDDPQAGAIPAMEEMVFRETGNLEVVVVARGSNMFDYRLTTMPPQQGNRK